MIRDPALIAREVRVDAGGRTVLRRASMTVARGSIHAVVGPNGAGKSTLLRALLGELPHRGEIRWMPRGSGVVGYVPQFLKTDPSLPLSVLDFLRLNLDRRPLLLPPRRRLRDIIDARLEEVGAGHLARRPLAVLSGGELRRVLIAQALVPTPELLLMDEPTANLDDASQRWLAALLEGLVADGITVIMVVHDAELVTRLADAVTRLDASGATVSVATETGNIGEHGTLELPARGVRP